MLFREIECNCWSIEQRKKECKNHGVDIQVLSTVPGLGFNYWAKPKDALEVAQFLNNHIAECFSANPLNFVGLATVPMQDTELAIQELRRTMSIGFKGVQIGTHINDIPLDDERFTEFWKVAEELKAAVFIHPWDMIQTGRMKKYWFPWLVGMPCETTIAVCSMVFGGVLENFPNLHVCFAHGGGSFAGTLGRIAHGFKMRPDLCQTVTTISPLYLVLIQVIN